MYKFIKKISIFLIMVLIFNCLLLFLNFDKNKVYANSELSKLPENQVLKETIIVNTISSSEEYNTTDYLKQIRIALSAFQTLENKYTEFNNVLLEKIQNMSDNTLECNNVRNNTIIYNNMVLINQSDYDDSELDRMHNIGHPNCSCRDNVIAFSGCGYVTLAMLLSSIKGENYSPYYFRDNYGYLYVCRHGCDQNLLSDVLNNLGINHNRIINNNLKKGQKNEDINKIVQALLNKHALICLASGPKKKGSQSKFTKYGHYLLINGYREKNGVTQVLVFDPNGLNHENVDSLALCERTANGGVWLDFSYIISDCKDMWIINY
ncbi:hypothetical protein SH2C18_37260 [Clostridium sediminicola]|uniref:C39 family peptidase n=1 Tax=Clostridium sediminicola TaxID=3114879 RepID=UPI0031F1D1F7